MQQHIEPVLTGPEGGNTEMGLLENCITTRDGNIPGYWVDPNIRSICTTICQKLTFFIRFLHSYESVEKGTWPDSKKKNCFELTKFAKNFGLFRGGRQTMRIRKGVIRSQFASCPWQTNGQQNTLDRFSLDIWKTNFCFWFDTPKIITMLSDMHNYF